MSTDQGYYGKGIYFSEDPSYSMDYIKGGNKLLLCKSRDSSPSHLIQAWSSLAKRTNQNMELEAQRRKALTGRLYLTTSQIS